MEPVTIQPLYGGAAKSVLDMTPEELDQVSEEVMRKVRERAFSRGLPVVLERNGKVWYEYADGRQELANDLDE